MKSTTTNLLLAIALPLFGFSQNESIHNTNPRSSFNQERPTQNVETVITTSQSKKSHLTKVSSNSVSSTITVHTYKYVNQHQSSTEFADSNSNESEHSTDIESIIQSFLNIEGVTRCSFDMATQTFTILTRPEIVLTDTVNTLNSK